MPGEAAAVSPPAAAGSEAECDALPPGASEPGDAAGAAEVAAWMRDEAGMELDQSMDDASAFVNRIKAAVRAREGDTAHQSDTSSILRMLAGQEGTAPTKRWWNA